jgi:hypothetical protein
MHHLNGRCEHVPSLLDIGRQVMECIYMDTTAGAITLKIVDLNAGLSRVQIDVLSLRLHHYP